MKNLAPSGKHEQVKERATISRFQLSGDGQLRAVNRVTILERFGFARPFTQSRRPVLPIPKHDPSTPLPSQAWLGLSREAYEPLYLAKFESLLIDAVRARIAELAAGKIPVLLCFESLKKPGEFCHRRMFADWWERKTGEAVAEL